MKRNALPIFIGLTLLAGCQDTIPNNQTKLSSEQKQTETTNKAETNSTFPYPNLLSDREDSYSLLAIGDNENPIEDNKKITDKVNDILSLPELEMTQEAYPELNIKSAPLYILFDQTGVVYQAKNLKELTTYLEKN
ncbi:hypothetical protein [Neobacillus niacini]|uniref:hypothetical protein n=1 Tax=Neobacillus niacini TaxID=86668 RepID=UPI0039834F69